MSKSIPPVQTAKVSLKQHRIKWQGCTACGLCQNATTHVFFRRLNRTQNAWANERFELFRIPKIRCDIVLMGEAPGEVEDCEGYPFVGEPGKKLESIVSQAADLAKLHDNTMIGMTNVVCCIPRLPEGDGVRMPTPSEAKACQPRLEEFLINARPKLIVCVGQTAKTLFPRGFGKAKQTFPSLLNPGVGHIIHPAAILRMRDAAQDTESARVRVELVRLFESVKTAVDAEWRKFGG